MELEHKLLSNRDKLADLVIKNLPEIIKKDEIPDNIIRDDTYIMKYHYLKKLDKWLAKLFGFYSDGDNFWSSKEAYKMEEKWTDFDTISGFADLHGESFYNILHNKLKNKGFETKSKRTARSDYES